jgi:hypothetical protein
VYNINSTEPEQQFDPDFSVNGITKQIRLTNVLNTSTVITIIKRQGSNWGNNQTEMNFINSVVGSEHNDSSLTYDSTGVTFDTVDTRF